MAANPHTQPEFGAAAPRAEAPKKSHAAFLALVLLLAIALGAGILYEISQRKTQEQVLAAGVAGGAAAGPPMVTVARVRVAPSEATVELPGQTEPLVETPVYARTDGYIKRRLVDLGSHVKKGDLMIELDTPDLDQQIVQARATLAQSQASLAQLQASLQATQSNLKLAQVTAQRTGRLAEEGVLSKQDRDTAAAALDASQANVHAAQESVRAQQAVIAANDANLKRFLETKNYARMEAPFDGVVTYRNPASSDPGTLITSGSGTSAREILRVSQIQKLRIFVNVPQSYAPVIRLGQPADLLIDEYPGHLFPARVQSTASAVDPASRTMLTVLVVDNSSGVLLPGMYTKVRFRLPHTVNVLRLPAEALMLRTEGPTAAVVDDQNRVHLHPLTLGRDYGSEVEVTAGLEKDDRVVLNPTDAVRENALVDAHERSGK